MRSLRWQSAGRRATGVDEATPILHALAEALVRPLLVACCDLDVEAVHGRAPLTGEWAVGHEGVAEVVAVGSDVTSVRPGDRVVVPFQLSCGGCRFVTGRVMARAALPEVIRLVEAGRLNPGPVISHTVPWDDADAVWPTMTRKTCSSAADHEGGVKTSTTVLGRIASDLEELPVPANDGAWRMAWHPPGDAPPGQPYGANAFCVTHDGEVVLVSTDGSRWEWPGGRPERGESWEDTLRREILEEACATISGARLLGFVRARCLSGHENGLVLVRSIWRAEVRLLAWQPAHEIGFRRVVPARDLPVHLWMEDGAGPIYSRAAREAALA